MKIIDGLVIKYTFNIVKIKNKIKKRLQEYNYQFKTITLNNVCI